MKSNQLLKMVTISALSFGVIIASTTVSYASDNNVLPDSSIIGTEAYVAPVRAESINISTPSITTNAIPTTASYSKSYKNLYQIVVATQQTYTQWTASGGRITAYNNAWQLNSTAPLYGYTGEVNKWNYKGTTSGEANQAVVFESGAPTPWGHVGGSKFTSRIVTTVNGNGGSSAY